MLIVTYLVQIISNGPEQQIHLTASIMQGQAGPAEIDRRNALHDQVFLPLMQLSLAKMECR